MGVRRVVLGAMVWLVVASGAFVLFSAPAWAEVTHPYTGHSFGPCGLSPSSCEASATDVFSNPQSVAVDQATGDVYVYDAGAGAVYKFNAAGEPEAFSGLAGSNAITGVGGAGSGEQQLAVDSSSGLTSGDIYVAHGATVQIFGPDGKTRGALSEAAGHPWGESCGVAVDPAGDVYVGLYESVVSEYTPGAGEEAVTNADYKASMGGLHLICNVAVDGGGDVYAATYFGGVSRFDHSQFGAPTASGTVLDPNGITLAVDPVSGDAYVDEGKQVVEYDPSGSLLGASGVAASGALSGSYGVAVRGSTGELYAASSNGTVEIFGAPATVPDVTTGGVSMLHRTSAVVSGLVNPDGVENKTTYYVQYGTGVEYGQQTVEAEALEGSSKAQEVSVQLGGLERETTYHYRLVAVDKNGTSVGEDHTLTTVSAVDVSVPCSATEVHATTATLASVTDSEGTPATFYQFQYGSSTEYGSSTALTEATAGETEEPLSVHIEGLTPNSLYHCRLTGRIGENAEGGFSEGADATFKTPAAAPAVNDQAPFATGVAPHEATLHGAVNPGNGITTYHFVYGTTAAYGSSTPEAFTQLNYEDDALEQLITGLQPGVVYHYALVSENESGSTTGPDQTFTTLPAPVAEPAPEPPAVVPQTTPVTLTLPGTPALLAAVVFPQEKLVKPSTKKTTKKKLNTCKKGRLKKHNKCVKQKAKKSNRRAK